ncbi:MAG: RNB domain-containing ribonuclease, partial [Ileibacterium sp.]|nr:RNB domain-containing ribonuclease [Ileibacterium sp.]
MREEVLRLLNEKKNLSLKELMALLHIENGRDTKELGIVLNELEDERLIYNNHSKYFLIDNEDWMVGSLRDISANDYAVANKDKRVFIPKNGQRIFMDKDEVLVKLGKENEIVHVYDRGIKYITGTFVNTRRGLKFRSDVDLHTSFIVTNTKDYALSPNMKAVVKVVDYTFPLKVKIVKLLGKENEPGVDVTAILCENEVRQEFNKKISKELDEIPDKVRKKEVKERTDLRELPTVTIDGESTKDFDDAISVKKLKNGGWRLWVHIADVSHYVKEGEEIDEEAFKRGTSIYVADRVVPMLPFQLSNGICSLNPDVDRLTLSCRMDFNAQGVMTDYDIDETVIHSNQRCTYGKVNQYLEDPESVPEYKEVGQMLKDF